MNRNKIGRLFAVVVMFNLLRFEHSLHLSQVVANCTPTFDELVKQHRSEAQRQGPVRVMALHNARNYQDAVVVASSLVEQINREDVNSMVQVQRDMLSRYEKTNEMLINFNLLSSSRFEVTVKEFQNHTQLLSDMKRDLDSIFKRIRTLKQRLSKQYPEAFSACSTIMMVDDEEEEEVQCQAASILTSPHEETEHVGVSKEAEGDGMPSPPPKAKTQKKAHSACSSKGGHTSGASASSKTSSSQKQSSGGSHSHDHGKRLSSGRLAQKAGESRNQRT